MVCTLIIASTGISVVHVHWEPTPRYRKQLLWTFNLTWAPNGHRRGYLRDHTLPRLPLVMFTWIYIKKKLQLFYILSLLFRQSDVLSGKTIVEKTKMNGIGICHRIVTWSILDNISVIAISFLLSPNKIELCNHKYKSPLNGQFNKRFYISCLQSLLDRLSVFCKAFEFYGRPAVAWTPIFSRQSG